MRENLLLRIENYLGNGGLFNPELMDHDKVRDLIVDIKDFIKGTQPNETSSPGGEAAPVQRIVGPTTLPPDPTTGAAP